jgi:hypothetical protein
VPEVPLDVLEVLIGGDHAGRVEFVRRDRGAQRVEPVQGDVNLVLLAGHDRVVSVIVTVKCLEVLYVLITGSDTPISDYTLCPDLTETAVQDTMPTESHGNFRLDSVVNLLPDTVSELDAAAYGQDLEVRRADGTPVEHDIVPGAIVGLFRKP